MEDQIQGTGPIAPWGCTMLCSGVLCAPCCGVRSSADLCCLVCGAVLSEAVLCCAVLCSYGSRRERNAVVCCVVWCVAVVCRVIMLLEQTLRLLWGWRILLTFA